jgi:hypothetical protein
MQKVCRTGDLEIGWGYVKRVEIPMMTAQVVVGRLRLTEGPISIREI